MSSRPPKHYEATRDWVQAISDLPCTAAPIPLRTVIVPRRRVAHALRREIVRQGQPQLLIGTRFITPLVAASEVLQRAGESCSPNERALRPLRLRAVFQEPPQLVDLDARVLREQLGWPEAIASALEDLESCGFTPELLPSDNRRLRDLAALWTRATPPGDPSETLPRILARATACLEADPALWPWPGPNLAGISPDTSRVEARFVRTIPGIQLLVRPTRVATERVVERARSIFGAEAAATFTNVSPVTTSPRELDRLRSNLFAANVPGSSPSTPDGSVELELYAGVDAEIDAAVDWVSNEILEHGTPLEDLAILSPNLLPVVPLLVTRLERLPWPSGTIPIVVPEGLPATNYPGGPRILGVLHALERRLDAGSLARILPWLRTTGSGETRLSISDAIELAHSLGTPGGHAVTDGEALTWSIGARRTIERLEVRLQRKEPADNEDGPDRETLQLCRRLELLNGLVDPLEELDELLVTVDSGAGLGKVWSELEDFIEESVSLPPDGKRVLKVLKEPVQAIEADPVSATVSGWRAIEIVRTALEKLRLSRGTFGEPGVYVGTISEARGIPFRAVRIIGISEAAFPRNGRPDPVLPEDLRSEVHPLCPRRADAALADRAALEDLIANTQARMVFSAAKQDLDGTGREPSGLFVDLATAMNRSGSVLDARGLERDYFVPARIGSATRSDRSPIGEQAVLRSVARRRVTPPARWSRVALTDPVRIEALQRDDGALPDGFLAGTAPHGWIRGVTPERPVSPSRLKTLIECPHRFLLEHVLSFRAPTTARSTQQVSPMAHGSAFHEGAEALVVKYGTRLPELAADRTRRGELRQVAMEAAEDELSDWPFADAVARGHSLQRLDEELQRLLDHDAGLGALDQMEAERHFGVAEEPVTVVADDGLLYFTGFIDRIEAKGGQSTVVDFKTGGAKPRAGDEAGPVAAIDLQLAVYDRAATQLGPTWAIPPPRAVEYRYVSRLGVEHRRFADSELADLRGRASEWLAAASYLLHSQSFPRSPTTVPCRDCHFRPVCGEPKNLESRARLEAATRDVNGGLARLARLYSLGEEEEGGDDE